MQREPVIRKRRCRRWPWVATIALLHGLSGCGGPPEQLQELPRTAAVDAKSVLLITLDGLRYDHMSLFGYERETTPRVDQLAARGRTYSNIVATSGSTKASLTSLFTGMDFRYHQIFQHKQRLPDDYVTLAELFRDAGYVTAAVVATPMLSKQLNYDQGFLIYEDFAREPGSGDYIRAEEITDRVLGILARFRENSVDAPLFLYAHFEEPHPPWHPPSPWLGASENESSYATQPFDIGCTYVPEPDEFREVSDELRARWIAKYDGAILQADRQIGRVIDQLKKDGRLEQTIVAISTDHGYDLLDKYAFGHGYGISDEIIRTFLVVYDGANEISRIDAPEIQGRTFDVGATLLAAAGLAAPEQFEGVDLIGYPDELPRYAFSVDGGVTAVRSLEHKLVHIDFDGQRPKPDYIPEFGFMMFDLQADPRELRDVQKEQSELFRDIVRIYEGYQADREREFVLGTRDPLSDETEERLRSLGYIN